MSASPQLTASASDADVAAAIARAERRREMLEHLSRMGMAMAQEITQRWIEGPYHPEPRHDQGKSFAAVSRAVRLTLVLEAKIDEQVLALRKDGVAALETLKAEPVAGPQPVAASAPPPLRRESPSHRRDRIHDCVREAIEREIGDPCEARALLGTVYGRLIDLEDAEADFLARDLRAQVEVVCAALDLKPDWSRWSDEEGFGPTDIRELVETSQRRLE